MASTSIERRVVITGLGVVTPLGNSVDVFWDKLIAGECGIDKINADFSAPETTATFTLCGDRNAAHETILSRNMNWTAQWIAAKTGNAPEPTACAGRSELLPEDGQLECPLPGNTDQ